MSSLEEPLANVSVPFASLSSNEPFLDISHLISIDPSCMAIIAKAAVALLALGTSMSLLSSLFCLAAAIGLLGHSASTAVMDTVRYWRLLAFFIAGGTYKDAPVFKGDASEAERVHIYSLSLIPYLWNKPHYRSGTFQNDMQKNLRNVALPGTGLPLSWLCVSRALFVAFLFAGAPMLSLAYALFLSKLSVGSVAHKYRELLLTPPQWFFFWRLNCRLASFHALMTKASGYEMEDKWKFLLSAEEKDIPISPFLKMDSIVVKDRNEEGGMGIHFYKNALQGGSWIIQPALHNDATLASWLPARAPLSTMRVITSSDGAADVVTGALAPDLATRMEQVHVLSCVFRAGREDAETDHSSILFDVDAASGRVQGGTTNAHWYKLGVHSDLMHYAPAAVHTAHPDSGVAMTGVQRFEDIADIKQLVCEAHAKMLPDVPLAGWDVAMTQESGRCLLEVNLSCNFFNGSFDKKAYFAWMGSLLGKLDVLKQQA